MGRFYRESDKMDLANRFQNPSDAQMIEPTCDPAMMDALIAAGVEQSKAHDAAAGLCSLHPNSNLMEIYGRSISDYATTHRRNLNIDGVGAFNLRTTKDDCQP